jgi:hypothetical protein
MFPIFVLLCYGSAAAVSLFALWHFGVTHWYWHLLSVAAALALGLAPLPPPWGERQFTLLVGWVFTALFLWGVAAPVVAALRHSPDPHFKQR